MTKASGSGQRGSELWLAEPLENGPTGGEARFGVPIAEPAAMRQAPRPL